MSHFGPSPGEFKLDLRGTPTSAWNVAARNVFLQYHFRNKVPSIAEQDEMIKRFNTYFWTLRREYDRMKAGNGDANDSLQERVHRAQNKGDTKYVSNFIHSSF